MYWKSLIVLAVGAIVALSEAAEEVTTPTTPPPTEAGNDTTTAPLPGDCSSKFKKDDKHSNVSETCTQELKINPDDMPKSEEEFIKTFDDKCFGKCFMTKMGFLVDDKFDRDLIKKDIEDHVLDADVKKKVLDYTMTCLDETEKAMKEDGGKITKANECKLCAQFLYCSMKQEEKLKC